MFFRFFAMLTFLPQRSLHSPPLSPSLSATLFYMSLLSNPRLSLSLTLSRCHCRLHWRSLWCSPSSGSLLLTFPPSMPLPLTSFVCALLSCPAPFSLIAITDPLPLYQGGGRARGGARSSGGSAGGAAQPLQAFVSGLMVVWDRAVTEEGEQGAGEDKGSERRVGSARDDGAQGTWTVIIGYGLEDEQSRILRVPLPLMEDWLFGKAETEGTKDGTRARAAA